MDVEALAEEIFAWLDQTQPTSLANVSAVPRPPKWVPDLSDEALRSRVVHARGFMERIDVLDARWVHRKTSPKERRDGERAREWRNVLIIRGEKREREKEKERECVCGGTY